LNLSWQRVAFKLYYTDIRPPLLGLMAGRKRRPLQQS